MVTVPGYDKPVEFPDSMSNADIEKVLQNQTKSFAQPKGEVSRLAGEHLKHMNPNAPEGPGMIERGIGKVVGTETAARMKGELPAAAGMVAMAALPEVPIGQKIVQFAGALKRVGAGVAASGVTKGALGGSAGEVRDEARDAALYGAFGEGVGVAVGQLAKVGGKTFERVVLNAAQQSQKGMKLIGDMETAAHQTLEKMVTGRSASVRDAYQALIDKLGNVPKGAGAAAEKLSGAGKNAVTELADAVSSDLRKVGAEGMPSLIEQPMEALITMHSRANRLAYGLGADVSKPVQKAAQEFADDLRGIITKNLTPEERTIFEATKNITKEGARWGFASRLAEIAGKRALGLIVGGATFGMTHSPVGALAATLGTEALEQKAAPIILQHLMETNRTAVQKAVEAAVGNPQRADEILRTAGNALARMVPKELTARIKEMATPAPKKDSVVNQEKQ